jgi:polyhydroxyalkanoate synthesis regulator phasin
VKDALKGYLALASGLTEVTRQRATAAAKALVAQGEATAGQVTGLADDLIAQSKSNREAMTALVRFEVDKALGRVGLASADEVSELTARVRSLESELRGKAGASTAKKAPAKKAPAKKAPAKKAPAKKAPAKKAAAKATEAPSTQAPGA